MKTLMTAVLAMTAATVFGGTWLSDAGGIAGFEKCAEISVAYGDGASLADYPVLVRVSPETISGFSYSDLRADGSDLVFCDAEGAVLPHEIDTWDVEGTSLIWVKFPSLAQGESVYLYYGNANVTQAMPVEDGPRALWKDYAGVWHMGEVFAAGASADDKAAYDSTSNGLNAQAKDASSGQVKIGEMTSYPAGAVGVARQNQGSNAKPGAYLEVPEYDSLRLGDTFTVSGWMRANEIGSGKYPRPISRKAAYDASNGWEIQVNNGSTTATTVRGANKDGGTVTYPKALTSGWNHYVWVFDGTTVTAYQNGALVTSVTMKAAATDNKQPLVFGCNASGTEQSWNGQFDEMRLADGLQSAEAVAADCAMVTNAAFLVYGAAADNDNDRLTFDKAPVMAVGDGVSFSVRIVGGEGTVTAEYTDLASSQTFEDTAVTLTGDVCTSLPTLDEGKLYSVRFKGVTSSGTVTYSKSYGFYSGTVGVAKVSDANEAGLAAGSFQVTITAAVATDLDFTYQASGTAVAGSEYVALSGKVTIPAGETSATIEVVPLLNSLVRENRSVAVTFAEGAFLPGTLSAELTVLDDPSATTDPTIRYVATNGSDENDGLTELRAFKTVAKAVEALGETGGRVFIAAGTYSETNSFVSVTAGTTTTNHNSCVILSAPVRLIGMTGDPADVVVTKVDKVDGVSLKARIVYLDNAEAELKDLTVRGGTGGGQGGGAVFITTNGGTIDHCVVEKGDSDANGAWDAGGGNILMEGGYVTRTVIRNGKSKSHGAGKNGGGIYMKAGLVENSLIYGNTCANGPSVIINGPGKLVNCTITGHSGSGLAGVKASSNAGVVNCAIFGNTCSSDATGHQHVWANSADAFDHCAGEVLINDSCFESMEGGFVDAAANDYHLTPASVCLENGASYELTGAKSEFDLDGTNRVMLAAVDIGCYEYAPDGMVIGFSQDKARMLTGTTVNFTASVLGAETDYVCYWDFDGDGEADEAVENGLTASYVYDVPGTNSVILRVVSGSKEIVETHADAVFVAPWDIYVDAANADGAAYPYMTRETAAVNIRAAVAAATDGTVIHVADGLYPDEEQIYLTEAITLVSESGDPSRCMVSNTTGMAYGGTPRRNLLLNNANAFVAGFTFAGGRIDQQSGAAIWINVGGGTVSNCVVAGAEVRNYYGSGAVCLEAGYVTHCTIERCYKYDDDRVLAGCALTLGGGNAVADNCLIRNCGNTKANAVVYVADNCTAYNLTVVDSFVPTNKAGIVAASKAKVYNSVVANVTTEDAVEEETVTSLRPWGGTAASFVNCAFDEACTGGVHCVVGTAREFFKGYDAGDFRPATGGLLVNTGDDAHCNGAITDLAGYARINGKHVDIGCYEGRPSGFALSVR